MGNRLWLPSLNTSDILSEVDFLSLNKADAERKLIQYSASDFGFFQAQK